MPDLVITRGLPASGKSTWAQQQVAKSNGRAIRVNRDDLRMEMFGEYVFKGPKASVREKEEAVTVEQVKRVRAGLDAGKNVYVDDTNLFHKAPYDWRRIAESYDGKVQFQIKNFHTSPEECMRRDAARIAQGKRGTGDHVIRDMSARFKNGNLPYIPKHLVDTIPTPPEAHLTKDNAVIFDIDGTLCDVRSVRHHVRPAPGQKRDFHRFHMDSAYCPPNKEVMEMARLCKEKGLKVLIVTARDEKYRTLTENWLKVNNIEYDDIYVRSYGDIRPDYEAKKDILNHIRKFYNPVHAVDDNPQVLQLWKEEGINYTLVPGFDDDIEPGRIDFDDIPIVNLILGGKCLKCGRKMKRDGVLGPECEKQ